MKQVETQPKTETLTTQIISIIPEVFVPGEGHIQLPLPQFLLLKVAIVFDIKKERDFFNLALDKTQETDRHFFETIEKAIARRSIQERQQAIVKVALSLPDFDTQVTAVVKQMPSVQEQFDIVIQVFNGVGRNAILKIVGLEMLDLAPEILDTVPQTPESGAGILETNPNMMPTLPHNVTEFTQVPNQDALSERRIGIVEALLSLPGFDPQAAEHIRLIPDIRERAAAAMNVVKFPILKKVLADMQPPPRPTEEDLMGAMLPPRPKARTYS